MASQPRLYIADLAAYNAGILHGAWIDADQDASDIEEEIASMLEASPVPEAEEWRIDDYEGFAGYRVEPHDSLEELAAFAQLLVEHGPIIAALVSHVGGLVHLDEAQTMLEEQAAGIFDSLEDFAYELMTETMAIPTELRPYIDYEKYARDLELSGEIVTLRIDRELHVFWTR